MNDERIHFASCLLANPTKTKVLLINKLRPDWQNGRVNIVGGGVDPGEGFIETAVREVGEETGIELEQGRLWYCGDIHDHEVKVAFFAAVLTEEEFKTGWTSKTDEVVGVFEVDNLPKNVIPNLKWIIPISLDPTAGSFSIWDETAGFLTKHPTYGLE